jgi:hypothetical protein
MKKVSQEFVTKRWLFWDDEDDNDGWEIATRS